MTDEYLYYFPLYQTGGNPWGIPKREATEILVRNAKKTPKTVMRSLEKALWMGIS
jgi:hypothetical protein